VRELFYKYLECGLYLHQLIVMVHWNSTVLKQRLLTHCGHCFVILDEIKVRTVVTILCCCWFYSIWSSTTTVIFNYSVIFFTLTAA